VSGKRGVCGAGWGRRCYALVFLVVPLGTPPTQTDVRVFHVRGPTQTDRIGQIRTRKWVGPLEMPLDLRTHEGQEASVHAPSNGCEEKEMHRRGRGGPGIYPPNACSECCQTGSDPQQCSGWTQKSERSAYIASHVCQGLEVEGSDTVDSVSAQI
jgi:hypothetical protein